MIRAFWIWVSAWAEWFADYGARDWLTLPRDLAQTFWRDVVKRGNLC